MNRPLRLVIFDLDGTLVDSLGGIYACIVKTLEHHDLPPVTESFVREWIGLALVEAWARIAPTENHHQLAETYKRLFLATRAAGEDNAELFTGAKEALVKLDDAGHLLGISTNKGRPGVHHVLDQHGIGGHFVAIRSAHDGHVKPHPDAVHDILARTGVKPCNTVFVGDTETDMMTAQNAGVAALGVAWGYHSVDRLRDTGAKAIAHEFGEVPALVEELIRV